RLSTVELQNALDVPARHCWRSKFVGDYQVQVNDIRLGGPCQPDQVGIVPADQAQLVQAATECGHVDPEGARCQHGGGPRVAALSERFGPVRTQSVFW